MGGRVAVSRRVESARVDELRFTSLGAAGYWSERYWEKKRTLYGALFANLSARDKTGWHELWIQQAAPLDHSLPCERRKVESRK